MRFSPPKTRTVWVTGIFVVAALLCRFLDQPLPSEHAVWFALAAYGLLLLACFLRGL